MANKAANVKVVEEIRRLKHLGFTKRAIARTLGIHRNTVTKYFDNLNTDDQPTADSSAPLATMSSPQLTSPSWVDGIDWQSVRDEVLNSVPIQIVYEELFDQGKLSVTYPTFWKQLQKRAPLLKTTMVRIFQPGSKIEVTGQPASSLFHEFRFFAFKEKAQRLHRMDSLLSTCRQIASNQTKISRPSFAPEAA